MNNKKDKYGVEILKTLNAKFPKISISEREFQKLSDGESGNSFNWNSFTVFNFCIFKKENIVRIKFHCGGDVRGNYTKDYFFACSKDDFFEAISEIRKVVKIGKIEVSIDIFADKSDLELYDFYNRDTGENLNFSEFDEKTQTKIKNKIW